MSQQTLRVIEDHEHDDPGWESDCHQCHQEGIGDGRSCPDCLEEVREVLDIAGRHL